MDVGSARQNGYVSNPELITAFDLDQWSDTLAAQTTLPILVRKLILATAPVSEITTRAGEGAQIPGWDGIVRCDAADAHVPLGISGWELGTSKDPRGKAQADIRTRAKDPLGLDPETTVFVAVTSRIWRDRDDWREARRKEWKWADVRAYDADDLVTWLERAPSVHHWISEQLGGDSRDVQTPKTVSRGGLTTAMTKDASAQALPRSRNRQMRVGGRSRATSLSPMSEKTQIRSTSCSARLRQLRYLCGGTQPTCGPVRTGEPRSEVPLSVTHWYSLPAFPKEALPVEEVIRTRNSFWRSSKCAFANLSSLG
jgi:hypothetical protein